MGRNPLLVNFCINECVFSFSLFIYQTATAKDINARPIELFMTSVLKRQGYGEGEYSPLFLSCLT